MREKFLKMTLAQLARRMGMPCAQGCLNLPVVDRTGIAGAGDFALERTCLASNCDTYASSLVRTGLKLEKTIAPAERLVIDHVDVTRTEN